MADVLRTLDVPEKQVLIYCWEDEGEVFLASSSFADTYNGIKEVGAGHSRLSGADVGFVGASYRAAAEQCRVPGESAWLHLCL